MNVAINPELERLVRERIARGDYENVEALVQEAVQRLIEEDTDLDAIRQRIRAAGE